MRIEYHGPKPAKTVTRFWGKEYRFAPFCEVDDVDGKVLLAECGDIFRLPEPGAPHTAGDPLPENSEPQEGAAPVRRGVYRRRRT